MSDDNDENHYSDDVMGFCDICSQPWCDRNLTYSCSKCGREVCPECGDGWLCNDCILESDSYK
jgi:hypothetical protein